MRPIAQSHIDQAIRLVRIESPGSCGGTEFETLVMVAMAGKGAWGAAAQEATCSPLWDSFQPQVAKLNNIQFSTLSLSPEDRIKSALTPLLLPTISTQCQQEAVCKTAAKSTIAPTNNLRLSRYPELTHAIKGPGRCDVVENVDMGCRRRRMTTSLPDSLERSSNKMRH